MGRCHRRLLRWVGVALGLALALGPAGFSSASTARPIGVVDFAIRPTLPKISGLVPGRFSADDATTVIQRAAPAGLAVISRTTVTQAQTALSWRDTDITSYARLNALANDAHATYLMIGTVDRFSVDRLSSGGSQYRGQATVHIQVFTAAPARISPAVTGTGSSIASVSRIVAQQALHDAIARAMPSVLAAIPSAH